jgi:hypothetical protein
MSRREDRAKFLCAQRTGDTTHWDTLRPTEKDLYRRQAEREGYSSDAEVGDAHAEVEESLRSRLDHLGALVAVVEGRYDEVDADLLNSLDIGARVDDHELQAGPDLEAAQRALDEYPLTVEQTTTFEVVLGVGGPHDRLLFECDPYDPLEVGRLGQPCEVAYEIRRVVYRYSWPGSAERELTGKDREVAIQFARRVVPDLAE